MKPSTKSILGLFSELEAEMTRLSVWEQSAPPAQALASTEPFAVDTLQPQQWLQWIFIPKIRLLIAQQHPLPTGFEIAPYFEQVWQQQPQYQALIKVIVSIDKEFSPC